MRLLSRRPLRYAALFLLSTAATLGEAPPARAQRAGVSQAYDTTLYSGLRWRNIGPNRGGRSIAAAGSTQRPLEYFFGATGGGVWKTTDGGTTWSPVTDGHLRTASVGALAVCEANPDIVYVGMGETQLRGNIMQGDGVYRSADAGKSWTHVGLAETHAIGRIRIHPSDCDRVHVAALGHPYGPNEERGIFRSTDGGGSWTKTLFRDVRTGAADLSIDPNNPEVMYAGLWEVNRTPWSLSSGGPGSGLFKSTDGGSRWTELTRNPGLPEGVIGKVGVSVSPADPNRVYAIIEAEQGGVFRSDDGGATWTRVNEERKLRQRAFYYTRLQADPKDPETVYVLNVGFWKSTDGGKTYEQIRTLHADNHDLWIAADDPQRMIEANDGGASVSVNGGKTWTGQDYPTAQMYHVVTTKHAPYHVCGAQQDNSTACVPSNGNGDWWYAVGGGESGYIAPHPERTDVFYAGSYGGLLTHYDRSNGQRRNIQVWPENPMGHSAEDIRERFQWTFPIVLSPHDPSVLYTASQHLWRSTDEGQSWTRISPDLSRADPRTLGPSGGPITLDQTSVETYGTIFTVAPSPLEPRTIWVGTDDGRAHITRDEGGSWQEITPPELPEFSRISLIEASRHAPGRAYLAANRYQLDDRRPYLFRTEDYGRSWTRIVDGIAAGDFLRAVREDRRRAGLLYAGTENGVYVSFDDGARWQSLQLNLPVTQISDLVAEENDLVVATHGRSFYVLDDIAPLRQLTPAVARARAHLYAPVDPVRPLDPGLIVYYHLARPAREVRLEFVDSAGAVIRSFTGTPRDTAATRAEADDGEEGPRRGGEPRVGVKAGMHRFVWNLRHEGAADFPGMILWAAGNQGPRVPPGSYAVRLRVDGASQSQPFRVRTDPRLGVSAEDLRAQYEMAMRIRDRTSDANRAVVRIRALKQQIDERLKRTEDPAVEQAGEALRRSLEAVEGEIYQMRLQSNQDPLNYPIRLNNKLAALQGVVESAEARPTDQTEIVFRELSTRLEEQLRRLDTVVAEGLPRFNQALRAKRLPPIREVKPAR